MYQVGDRVRMIEWTNDGWPELTGTIVETHKYGMHDLYTLLPDDARRRAFTVDETEIEPSKEEAVDKEFDRVAQANERFETMVDQVSEAIALGLIPLWYAKACTLSFYMGVGAVLTEDEFAQFNDVIERAFEQDLAQLQRMGISYDLSRQQIEQQFLTV